LRLKHLKIALPLKSLKIYRKGYSNERTNVLVDSQFPNSYHFTKIFNSLKMVPKSMQTNILKYGTLMDPQI